MTASGVLVILPVIVFSFAAQRHLVAGLSSGAVKGSTDFDLFRPSRTGVLRLIGA